MTERIIQHNALTVLARTVFDAVIAVDRGMRICLLNSAAEAAYGLNEDDVLGTRLDEHAAFQSLVALAQWAITSGETAREQTVLPSGETRWVHVLITPEATTNAPRLPLGMRTDDAEVVVDPMREIVHDLKVRIAATKGFLDLVAASGELIDKQQKFMQRAHLSLTSMLSQVNEILDMSWLEAGGALDLCLTDLNKLAQRAVKELEGFAHHSGVTISLDLPPEGCTVNGDERRLASAIGNLVGNAIKYSPQGGPVHVSITTHNQTATFRVEDHGIGIPAEHLPRLYQRFYRVRTPETRRIEGSGLGLAIVKEIIQKHDGQVFVESVPAQGSTFGFTLPLP
jgi:two-component system phosphate regulon sensor histidine kinase PhoR